MKRNPFTTRVQRVSSNANLDFFIEPFCYMEWRNGPQDRELATHNGTKIKVSDLAWDVTNSMFCLKGDK